MFTDHNDFTKSNIFIKRHALNNKFSYKFLHKNGKIQLERGQEKQPMIKLNNNLKKLGISIKVKHKKEQKSQYQIINDISGFVFKRKRLKLQRTQEQNDDSVNKKQQVKLSLEDYLLSTSKKHQYKLKRQKEVHSSTSFKKNRKLFTSLHFYQSSPLKSRVQQGKSGGKQVYYKQQTIPIQNILLPDQINYFKKPNQRYNTLVNKLEQLSKNQKNNSQFTKLTRTIVWKKASKANSLQNLIKNSKSQVLVCSSISHTKIEQLQQKKQELLNSRKKLCYTKYNTIGCHTKIVKKCDYQISPWNERPQQFEQNTHQDLLRKHSQSQQIIH